MTALRRIIGGLSGWIESVAVSIVSLLASLTSRRTLRLVEEEPDAFVLKAQGQEATSSGAPERFQIAEGRIVGTLSAGLATMLRGSQIELVLRPSRFLFRPLELPRRAAEFLSGIVRAQIDRLTPWSPTDAAFGWSPPREAGADRINLTIAATARAVVAPLVQALVDAGAKSVAVSTLLEETGAAAIPIKVLEERAPSALDVQRVYRVLVVTLLVAVVALAGAVSAATVLASHLGARQDEVARRINERRAALRAAGDTALDPVTAAQRTLERRKHETASSVIVLETLSQILPDHTYVTELRVEGDKLRVIGLTRDAPSLIRIMEQSPQFTRATFFAPTTRSPADPGERFHIEAQIQPVFSPRS
jgi:general secretion pathway protein L